MKKRGFIYNTFFNMFYKVINLLFPLVTLIFVSRILHAEGIGKVSSAQNIVSYFTLIAGLGIPNYGIREIAKNQKNKNTVFWELFIINACSTSACIISYYIWIHKCGKFNSEIILYDIVGLSILFNYINVDWFYYGCEKYDYIAIRSLITKILSFMGLFFVVREEDDYYKYALILCLATGANYICNIINLHNEKLRLTHNERYNFRRHIKSILILLSTTISIELYTLLDTTMLTFWTNDTCVGLYSNAGKLVKTVIILLVSVSGALLPRLTTLYEKNKYSECETLINLVFGILFVFAVPCGIGIYVIAPIIVPLMFGKSFIGAITTVRILSFLTVCLTFSNLFGTQVLLSTGNEKKLLLVTVLGAITNILLNILLVPIYAQNGAAFASVVSEGIVTLLSFFLAKKIFEIKLDNRTIWSTVISSGIMLISILVIGLFVKHTILKLVLQIIFGILIYYESNCLLKNPIFVQVLDYKKYITGSR